jgi:hypothetical protein
VSVVTCPTGQFVTVGAQEVTVYTDVVLTMDVVYDTVGEVDVAAPLPVDVVELDELIETELEV